VALYLIVGCVDLGGDPLGPGALLGLGKPVGVVALGIGPSGWVAARTSGGCLLGAKVVEESRVRHPSGFPREALSLAARHSSEAPLKAASNAPLRTSPRSRPVRRVSRKRSSS
jgi:hypothetical protein